MKEIASKHDVSLADTIVLAGNTAVEEAATAAGFDVDVPFISGRGDASQDMTDENSFSNLEPHADGYRNWIKKEHADKAEEMMLDKTQLLGLTAP